MEGCGAGVESVGRRGSTVRGLGEFFWLTVLFSSVETTTKNLPPPNVVVLEMAGGTPRDEGEI